MRLIYSVLGSFSLGLGIVGIILPILPTVPFLLLTTYLYSKSSKRFNTWFTRTRIYKHYLSDFIERKTMTAKKKWTLLISVDLVLLISFILVDHLLARMILIILFLVKHYYFYRYVKTENHS